MGDAIIEAIEGLAGSPWIYAAILGLAALDAFLVVPSETLVITAGVFAVTGESLCRASPGCLRAWGCRL